MPALRFVTTDGYPLVLDRYDLAVDHSEARLIDDPRQSQTLADAELLEVAHRPLEIAGPVLDRRRENRPGEGIGGGSDHPSLGDPVAGRLGRQSPATYRALAKDPFPTSRLAG